MKVEAVPSGIDLRCSPLTAQSCVRVGAVLRRMLCSLLQSPPAPCLLQEGSSLPYSWEEGAFQKMQQTQQALAPGLGEDKLSSGNCSPRKNKFAAFLGR